MKWSPTCDPEGEVHRVAEDRALERTIALLYVVETEYSASRFCLILLQKVTHCVTF